MRISGNEDTRLAGRLIEAWAASVFGLLVVVLIVVGAAVSVRSTMVCAAEAVGERAAACSVVAPPQAPAAPVQPVILFAGPAVAQNPQR